MLIERTKNNKITITVSSSIDSFGLQRVIDYVKYLEATSKSKAKQSDVDKLADEVNASWWTKNKKRKKNSAIVRKGSLNPYKKPIAHLFGINKNEVDGMQFQKEVRGK